VDHHCTRPEGNRLDSALGYAILMVSSDTAVGSCLIVGGKVIEEFLCTKRVVIASERLDLDSELRRKVIEGTLAN